MSSSRPLEEERDALRLTLHRLMSEETSIDNLCKHLPRIASVSANVARIQAALEADVPSDTMEDVLKAIREINAEAADQDGDSW